MSDLNFSWKGISSDAFGIVVTRLPDDTGREQRDEAYPVRGRDGALHVQDGALEETQWPVAFYLPYEQGATVSALREIKSWLKGEGWLTLSNRPGYKYRALIIDASTYTDWVQGYTDIEATVYFTVSPYSYLTDSPEDVEITATTGIITNSGLEICKPVWTIYGTGNLVLAVGTQICELTGVDGHITVDSSNNRIHKDGVMCYSKVSGELPVLSAGANTFAVTGDGTFVKIVYSPNWRDH